MSFTFDDLWNEHPYTKDGEAAPCKTKGGDSAFANQCAIRLGIALRANGVDTRSFRGARCWFGHGADHILRAEQLAGWLKTQQKVFGKVAISKSPKVSDYVAKTGILFCKDFRGADGGSFDHIDLWDGHQGPNYRFAKGADWWIDNSAQVWFWTIN